MNLKKEKNVNSFNNDVRSVGRYIYTGKQIYSAVVATKRQTDEAIFIIKRYIGKNIKMLDIGCGDGTYTLDLFNAIRPKLITGFDNAQMAIIAAQNKAKKSGFKSVFFNVGDIYNIDKEIGNKRYDIAVVRGVLHHLYNPEIAIKNIAKTASKVIIIEPNGYNPILKVIEKFSEYHKEHDEKSYYPPVINKWFSNNGFKVIEQKFVGLVPYFCPEKIARLLKKIEPYIENLPVFSKLFLGSNIVLYEKA
jgi:SAM-dependent methyltransferase